MTPGDVDGSPGPVVVLMCGVAGSGRTTYAQRLEDQGYVRLSIDEEVWQRHGRYGIDYDAADYARLSAAAEEVLRERLAERARRRDANAAFPITEDLLATYLSGFEVPRGEGEEVVRPAP